MPMTGDVADNISELRKVRQDRGLSLRETARRAGIDFSHLSRMERGRARISLEQLARIAEALDLRELSRLIEPYQMREPDLSRAQDSRENSNDGKPTAA